MKPEAHRNPAGGSCLFWWRSWSRKTAPMKEVSSGVFGMIAGDADGDGVVGAADGGLVFNNRGRVALVP